MTISSENGLGQAYHLGKYHGIGNDFLVLVDPTLLAPTAAGLEPNAALARWLCDRHEGLGADGLIHAGPGGSAPFSFRLWNADGSEAEMSGNGMRCLAHALLDHGLVGATETFTVVTPAGTKQVTLRPGADPATAWASVDMGVVKVQGETDRCNVGHGQLLVDVGNPHLVIAGPDPAYVDVAVLGPALERSDPAGLNVEFVTLGPGPDELTMRVWERGVGETQACGTGSCAAAAAFNHWGRVGTRVTVHQPGGAVEVALEADGTVHLAGPSRRVGASTVSLDDAPVTRVRP